MIRKYRRAAAVLAGAGALWAMPAATPPVEAGASKPSARMQAAMAYDPTSQKLVLFGGRIPDPDCIATVIRIGNQPGVDPCFDTVLDDTWRWDGSRWRKLAPVASPPRRFAAPMESDPARKGIVLFGGEDQDQVSGTYTALGDTWTWEGPSKTWTDVTPSQGPPPRADAAIAKDSATKTVVLFGGTNGEATNRMCLHRNDTWIWDGAAKTWTLANPPMRPSPRYGAAMAYDGATGTIVLFGGAKNTETGSCAPNTNETWIWNGTTQTWAQVTPPVSPPATNLAMMDYDAARKKVVLFGGTASGGYSNATWLWDGVTQTWTEAAPARRPLPRIGGAMEYHVPSKLVVLTGGFTSQSPPRALNDTWVWNGTNWKQLA